MNIEEKVISWLFETKALRVCPEGKPFWYTSGAIGPYYVNAHFLYGNEEKSAELLNLIEEERDNQKKLLECVFDHIRLNYRVDKIFFDIINALIERLKFHVEINEIDAVSGGERRDWFFSMMIAELLDKPHISVFKDQTAYINLGNKIEFANNDSLAGKNILHVADLINEGSSYEKAWAPAIKRLGGRIRWSLATVDRKQGGGEKLGLLGIKSYSLLEIDKSMFKNAKILKYISDAQFEMISSYIDDPRQSMADFIKNNPEFIKKALVSDEKTRHRATLCINNKIYGDFA